MSSSALFLSSPEALNLTGLPDRLWGWGRSFLLGVFLSTAAFVGWADEIPDEPVAGPAPALEIEILEMAIEQCLRGEAAGAQALFKAIREQLDPPPEHLQLINRYEANGCRATAASSPVRWGVQLGAGYDNNVNQGIAAQTMILGSGLNAIELPLGDVYKPLASPYAVAGVDASFRLGDFAIGQATLQHRANQDVPALNLTSLMAAAVRPFTWLERPGRVQIDLGETWLGGAHYQRAGAAGIQWLVAGGEQPWLASLATQRTRYTSQPEQDSQLTEAGIWRERLLASKFGVFGGLSVLHDRAVRQRPGGDRTGWRYQLGVTTGWNEWLIQPRLNVLRWRSSEVYSPGLVDVVRKHQLALLDLQFVRPIGPGQQLVVEWRLNDARDTVPLFSYRGQSLGVYWRLQR